LRVVFDTNILVSALVFPGGRGEAALLRIVKEQDQLIISKPILDELLGVLGRKFARDAEELAHAAVFVAELGILVRPRKKLHVLADDPDNRILECAIAGRADAIVTGDKALLKLHNYLDVRILSLQEFLED
jgi:putative PIN family toxin of toxin-antitoxin system